MTARSDLPRVAEVELLDADCSVLYRAAAVADIDADAIDFNAPVDLAGRVWFLRTLDAAGVELATTRTTQAERARRFAQHLIARLRADDPDVDK